MVSELGLLYIFVRTYLHSSISHFGDSSSVALIDHEAREGYGYNVIYTISL
jgi:hypothetical protein